MVALTAARERRFEAMGTSVHVIVVGAAGTVLDQIEHRVRDLEDRWSRFRPDSEVSRLNRADGVPVSVGPATIDLVERACAGWRLTNGRFDPTVLDQMNGLGYDRTFDELSSPIARSAGESTTSSTTLAPAPGCAGIEIDPHAETIRLPAGIGFDPGGMGKGLAADMASAEAMAAGARGVLVNIGGDLRVRGNAPEGDRWAIRLRDDTLPDMDLGVIHLIDAGLATSTTQRRRWRQGQSARHHLIDPSTGQPHTQGAVLATAIAGDAWWAEVATKALIADADVPDGCAALRVLADGTEQLLGGFEAFRP